MCKDKLVTVFMPVYNKGSYISKSLDSVLVPKVNFEYEILIIDDYSTDKSVEIVQEYLKKYPDKMKFIRNEKNMMLLFTATKGYELIKTKYWTVLDPDDYWLGTTKMQCAIEFLESHPDFTLYATNTCVDDGIKKSPMFEEKAVDYDFYSNNIIYIAHTHTSGTFYRNVFTKKEIDEIKKYVGTKFEYCFRGDSFRNFYHLKKGKAHYEPKIESVYNFYGGLYSSSNGCEKDILNLRIFFRMFDFFNQERPEFFLSLNWHYLKKVVLSYMKEVVTSLIDVGELFEIFKQCMQYRNKFNIVTYGLEIYKDCYFYLPSYIGGVCEKLFVNFAKYLADVLDFNVNYIDYTYGFATTKLQRSKVKIVPYSEDVFNMEEQDWEPFNIITPITKVLDIPKFKHPSARVILFCSGLNTMMSIYGPGFVESKLFLKKIFNTNSNCFVNLPSEKMILKYLNYESNSNIVQRSLDEMNFLLNKMFEHKEKDMIEQNKKYEDILYHFMKFVLQNLDIVLFVLISKKVK